ncbi:MAG TPA: nucleotidyltransferase family protein [Kofleriaceae bacterium]|nr:nucleotidyltransferase family protein [Kofleriaceae bacterium]
MTGRAGDAGVLGLGAVILAAGAGTRLGGVAKALLRHGGKSYLEAICGTARAVGLVDAVVVVGAPFAADVAAHARQLGLRVRVNPAPERGMASSVALGFAALANGPATAAWLWPVDHPAVQPATLRRLVEALEASDGRGDPDGDRAGHRYEVAQPRHRGAGGHPPLIRRALWPALAACAGRADGARGVLRAARSIAVEVDDPGVVRDVDTPADLETGA